jgi:tetratricopeptide (TPR) repeat protein
MSTADESATLDRVDEVIADYLDALHAGRRPNPEEWLRRYPDVACELAAFFADRDQFQSLAPPLEQTTGPYIPVPRDVPGGAGPRSFGDYELLEEIARGGMGVVYRARQISLNRIVALKMIRPGKASPDYLARFRLEARAVARMQHPNIVQIFEVGEEDGCPFFALEFVEDGSLARYLDGTPQPARQAAALTEVLARAIHVAHRCHIIHRDLKPANILLAKGPEFPTHSPETGARLPLDQYVPKITDFGLAKQLETTGSTASGVIVGTPCYMAPEQTEKEGPEVGPAVDVYALGVVLYEVLTGRPPFKGTSHWETLEQVRNQDPVPPGRLQPGVPRDLEIICLKCLSKEPGRRYASAAELADDLRRFLDGRPIKARPVPAWERAWKWVRRRPAAAAVVAALVLLAVSVVVGSLFYGLYKDQEARVERKQRERQQRVSDLRLQGEKAKDERRYEDALSAWDQALALLGEEKASGPSVTRLRKDIDDQRAGVQKLLAEKEAQRQWQEKIAAFEKDRDQIVFLEIPFREGDVPLNSARIRRETPRALEQVDLRGASEAEGGVWNWKVPPEPVVSGAQHRQLAAGCYQVLLVWAEAEATAPSDQAAGELPARVLRALRLLDRADALARDFGLRVPQAYHLRRAHYLSLLGEADRAREERQRAERTPRDTALDHFLTALHCYRRGQFDQAAAACEQVLGQEANHFWAQYLQALCHLKARNWEQAKAELTACLGRRPDFPWPLLLRASARSERAHDLALRGDADRAREEFRAAETDFARALQQQAADKPFRALVLTSRGQSRLRQQRWDDAVADLKEVLTLQPDSYEGYLNLAQAYRGRKDGDAAVQALDQALARRPELAALYYLRARVHLERGDPAAARGDLEQYLARETPVVWFAGVNLTGSGTSERLASARVELGRLKHKAGAFEAALADFDAALRVLPDYPPAHRQRAQTLLALGRHADAGQALDAYLARGRPLAEVYQARGLIHAQLGEQLQAVDAYTRALHLKPDPATLNSRGWAHLQLDSVKPALADFEAALKLDPAHTDARCGRGLARALLGQTAEAVRDAEAALQQMPRTGRVQFLAACIYARAVGQLEAAARTQPALDDERFRHQESAVALLRGVLEQLPPEERKAFWRDHIRYEAALASLRDNRHMLELARQYGR